MTSLAAVAFSGIFTSCSHDVDLSGGAQGVQKRVQQNYEEAFKSRFGEPAPTQTWGFVSTRRATTRAYIAAPSLTEAGLSFNAKMAAAGVNLAAALGTGTEYDYFKNFEKFNSWYFDDGGWEDRYYNINASVVDSDLPEGYLAQVKNIILEQIPEGGNNLAKATSTGYSITTTGGPVTLTPIYHNSNSGDKISYYYYPANQEPTVEQIKKMKKYTIGNMADPAVCNQDNYSFYRQTFSLVYEDGNGNVSYDFPEGYVINFIIQNTWVGNGTQQIYKSGGEKINGSVTPIVTEDIPNIPEFYGDGRLNVGIHKSGIDQWNLPDYFGYGITEPQTPHVAVFSIGDKNFIGFEDWKDYDFNDVIFEVTGTEGGEEIEVELDEWEELRVIAEDLTVDTNTDFDFNDVVFDVLHYTKGPKAGTVEVVLQAAGGTLPLYVAGHEVHEEFGVAQNVMVNTNAAARGHNGKDDAGTRTIPLTSNQWSGTTIEEIANSIEIKVIKDDVPYILTAPVGGIASKIGVKPNYDWCDERQDIDNKYSLTDGTSLFTEWVQGIFPASNWYTYAKKSIDEYKAAKAALNGQ